MLDQMSPEFASLQLLLVDRFVQLGIGAHAEGVHQLTNFQRRLELGVPTSRHAARHFASDDVRRPHNPKGAWLPTATCPNGRLVAAQGRHHGVVVVLSYVSSDAVTMTVLNFRTDERSERALAELMADGSTASEAIRQALVDAVRLRRREQMRAELRELMNDEEDLAESRRVLADMDEIRAW